MLSWLRERKYRKQVLVEMMTIHLMPDKGFKSFLGHYFPGAFTAIRKGHKKGQNTTELGVTLSAMVMAATIEGLDATRRQRIQEEVTEWAKTPGAIHDLNAAIETARDGFAGRIKWAIAYVAKLELSHNLDDYFLEFFCSEIFGSLAGKSRDERAADRLGGFFEKAMHAG